jgi:DNA recombination protein RmuC
MLELIAIIALLLLVLIVILQVVQLRRGVKIDLTEVKDAIVTTGKSSDRIEVAVRSEIAVNREEASRLSLQSRTELAGALKNFGDSLSLQLTESVRSNEVKFEQLRGVVEQQLQSILTANEKKLEQIRLDSFASAKELREEVSRSLKDFNQALVGQMSEMANAQKGQLDIFSERLDKLTAALTVQLGSMRETIEARLTLIQQEGAKKLEDMRTESLASAQKAREEVTQSLNTFGEIQTKALDKISGEQGVQLTKVIDQIGKLTEATEKKLLEQRNSIDQRLEAIQRQSTSSAIDTRQEISASLKAGSEAALKTLTAMSENQQKQIEGFSQQMGRLTESNQQQLKELREGVETRLKAIQDDNNKQITEMRQTVDEKLQSTLDKRLTESFKQVGERLQAVYEGLGEMKALATGVGDLKKVLTNVKTRGTWGEVQLGNMLEQVLSVDQYAANVSTKGNEERVEFAVKLPGKSDHKDEVVWLPIDAKFPVEDYQRLVEAQEKADLEAVEVAGRQLEISIKASGRSIAEKYLNPPKTTDFGILFLPTEGLFAEVVRRPGLADLIQREHRVVIAGPTTLWAILNSLQMGFRTLAIEKRSSEVWTLLGAVKTEWTKYGDVLTKVKKKLEEASNTIDTAQTRSRVIGRKLREVQELPTLDADAVLKIGDGDAGEDEPAPAAT